MAEVLETEAGPMTSTGGSSTQILSSLHMDYIHCVAFDVYGRRMATCSGDRFVRVWDLTDRGEWSLVGEWQAHRGSVEKICWAHPEFGSLLATCGSDHEAKIFEERTHANTIASRWTVKAQLTEARRAVNCVEFAPRHWGLKLATGGADGCVRIYEAVDIMNLSQWSLGATLNAFAEGLGVTCLSWNSGRFEPPTLVVGGTHLIVYQYSDANRSWLPLLQLPGGAEKNVLDVAWAPNVGRRYHYIASAEDKQLSIYKLNRGVTSTTTNENSNKPSQQADSGLELDSTQTLDAKHAWRCQWNVTGTVLASSGDAGIVQFWKSDMDGQFECVSQISGDVSGVARST